MLLVTTWGGAADWVAFAFPHHSILPLRLDCRPPCRYFVPQSVKPSRPSPPKGASGTRDASCQLRTVRQQRPAQPPGRGSKVVPGVESALFGVVALSRQWQRFCEVF